MAVVTDRAIVRGKWGIGTAILLLIVGPGLVLLCLWRTEGPRSPEGRMETHFYVWQRAWVSPVREAVARAAETSDGFMVLAGEFECGVDGLSLRVAPVDWAHLAGVEEPVTAVLRSSDALGDALDRDGAAETARRLSALIREVEERTKEARLRLSGVQLDYDCPTSGLSGYAALLAALRRERPRLELSITTLPTWLSSSDFPRLVHGLAYFVLQVHSFERPKTIEDAVDLCPVDRVPRYVAAASRVGEPFFVALPTYGYDVAFDAAGRFAGLGAETHSGVWPAGYRVREAVSDPGEMIRLVRHLQQASAPMMRGIVWFRLPVDTDRHNWSWPTMLAVLAGDVPQPVCSVEVRSPRPGLYEVWLSNREKPFHRGRVAVDVDLPKGRLLARDILRDFGETPTPRGWRLSGSVPASRKTTMVAWYTLEEELGGTVEVGQVEALQ